MPPEVQLMRRCEITQVTHLLESIRGSIDQSLLDAAREIAKDLQTKVEIQEDSKEIYLIGNNFSLTFSNDTDPQGIVIHYIFVGDQHKGTGSTILQVLENVFRQFGKTYIAVDLSINDGWWISRGFELIYRTLEFKSYSEGEAIYIIGTLRKRI